MLIPEKGGNGSAMAKENKKEIKEVISDSSCNELLDKGWGLLAVVPAANLSYSVAYVMVRTVS